MKGTLRAGALFAMVMIWLGMTMIEASAVECQKSVSGSQTECNPPPKPITIKPPPKAVRCPKSVSGSQTACNPPPQPIPTKPAPNPVKCRQPASGSDTKC